MPSILWKSYQGGASSDNQIRPRLQSPALAAAPPLFDPNVDLAPLPSRARFIAPAKFALWIGVTTRIMLWRKLECMAISAPMLPTRRTALASALLLAAAPARAADPDPARLAQGLALADATPHLRTLIVAQRGVPIIERVWRGANLARPTNIKSAARHALLVDGILPAFAAA